MDRSRKASFIAVKFRRLAEKFREAAKTEFTPRIVDTYDAAGKLIIRSCELGCLDEIEGLAELVAWAKSPTPELGNRETNLVPCAANLFWEFCGFNQVGVRNVGGVFEIVRGVHGGLLPTQMPEILPDFPTEDLASKEKHYLYYSEVCEWLADEVGKARNTADFASASSPGATVNPVPSTCPLHVDGCRISIGGEVHVVQPHMSKWLARLIEARDDGEKVTSETLTSIAGHGKNVPREIRAIRREIPALDSLIASQRGKGGGFYLTR